MRSHEIDELFSDSGEARVTTLLFRGEALTPDGLSQMHALLNDIVTEPGVGELLTATDSVIAPSLLYQVQLQVGDFGSVTQADIDSAPVPPEIQLAFDALNGNDEEGNPASIATIRLRETGDERIDDTERKIHELALASEGSAASEQHLVHCD